MSGAEQENVATKSSYLRSDVESMAASDWEAALRLAGTIPVLWYRVQSIAIVAQHAPDEYVDAILEAAIREASLDDDAYNAIAVLNWVIDAAVSRNRPDVTRRLIDDILLRSPQISPPKSRGFALEILLERTVNMSDDLAERVANDLLDVAAVLAKDPIKKWRKWGISFVNRTTFSLSRCDPLLAERVLTTRFGADRARRLLNRHSVNRAR